MASSASYDFTFEGDLVENLRRFPDRLHKRLHGLMAFEAQRMKASAKQRASWIDRTSNARNGLDAKAISIPHESYSIVLYHQVPYGIWLEVRWSGKYAIIMPTIQRAMPELGALLNGLFDDSRDRFV